MFTPVIHYDESKSPPTDSNKNIAYPFLLSNHQYMNI